MGGGRGGSLVGREEAEVSAVAGLSGWMFGCSTEVVGCVSLGNL